jgi:small neutral amino acid transporter SnatA (MarC family)
VSLDQGRDALDQCGVPGGAADAAALQLPVRRFPLAQIFTFMFLMLGPFKIIAPFLRVTRGADAAFTRQIAFRSTLFASLALLVAAFLGNKVLSSYGIPLPILSLAAGIILFLVALQTTLAQFAPVRQPECDDRHHIASGEDGA